VRGPRLAERAALAARALHVDVSNFYLLQYRQVDGYLTTAKNSGTHWLKFMMSHAIATEHGLPPPCFTSGQSSDDYVSHPKWPQKYPQTPRIGASHNLPSALLGWRPLFRTLKLPPTVVLVRDIREALLSNYLKWRAEKGLMLSDYVYAPAPGQRTLSDVWWYIDFFNRWGRMAVNMPEDVLIVRYEDLQIEPKYWLDRVLRHYGVEASAASISAAVAASGRERMRSLLDPNFNEVIIPAKAEREAIRFSPRQDAHLSALLSTHLKYSLGYGYAAGSRPSGAGRADEATASDPPIRRKAG